MAIGTVNWFSDEKGAWNSSRPDGPERTLFVDYSGESAATTTHSRRARSSHSRRSLGPNGLLVFSEKLVWIRLAVQAQALTAALGRSALASRPNVRNRVDAAAVVGAAEMIGMDDLGKPATTPRLSDWPGGATVVGRAR